MINITKYSAICNLGENINDIFNNAIIGKITPHRINFELPTIENPKFNLKCNRMLIHLYNQIKPYIDECINKYGKDKVGIVIATTNSGIREFETTKDYTHLKISNPAEFFKDYLNLNGYYACVSTACSSGIKVFSLAKRLLEFGICDCVITGGVDSVANMPNAGFKALEVLCDNLTNPFSKNRKGMNIGEGGALFILEKDKSGVKLSGFGETSDAYNAATPDPSGEQAVIAIEQALSQANISSDDIDYINLHGTGTISNDLMEATAINKIFKRKVPCSSTKPLTGHCLGAAASIETALCIKSIEENKLLPHIFDGIYDDTIPKLDLVKLNAKPDKQINYIMNNSFGFGGTNAVMILGR